MSIDEVIDNFDWDRVERVMLSLDWNWSLGTILSVEEMKSMARDLLSIAVQAALIADNGRSAISSHGFEARVATNGGEVTHIKLAFVLADWGTHE